MRYELFFVPSVPFVVKKCLCALCGKENFVHSVSFVVKKSEFFVLFVYFVVKKDFVSFVVKKDFVLFVVKKSNE